jgi:hypothetical protein
MPENEEETRNTATEEEDESAVVDAEDADGAEGGTTDEGVDEEDEWAKLKDRAAGYTPEQVLYFAAKGEEAAIKEREAEEQKMWAERERETGKGKPDADAGGSEDDDDQEILTKKDAERLAAKKAEEVFARKQKEVQTEQLKEAEHGRLLEASGVSNPVIKDMLRSYAEKLESGGASLEIAYRDALKALKKEGLVDDVSRIRTGVKNTAAMRKATGAKGAGTGGQPPSGKSTEGETTFPDEDLQRHMTYQEAQVYIAAPPAKQQEILARVKQRAATRR